MREREREKNNNHHQTPQNNKTYYVMLLIQSNQQHLPDSLIAALSVYVWLMKSHCYVEYIMFVCEKKKERERERSHICMDEIESDMLRRWDWSTWGEELFQSSQTHSVTYTLKQKHSKLSRHIIHSNHRDRCVHMYRLRFKCRRATYIGSCLLRLHLQSGAH